MSHISNEQYPTIQYGLESNKGLAIYDKKLCNRQHCNEAVNTHESVCNRVGQINMQYLTVEYGKLM